MEDESGLELSLGLSYGQTSSRSKSSDASPYSKLDEGNSSKLVGGNINVSDISIKNFFEINNDQELHVKQKTEQHQTFLAMLGKCSGPPIDASNDVHNKLPQSTGYQDLRSSVNKTAETEEEKSVPNKRKSQFEDINSQKKHEKTDDYIDVHGNKSTGITSVRNSRVSATTEDGSFGENEDVAESICSDAHKYTDKHVLSDPNGISSQELKVAVSGNESILEPGKVAYGIPVSFQPVTVMTVPYPVPVKVPSASTAPNAVGFPPPCVMQMMPFTNREQSVVRTTNSTNLQLAFGYSTVQLPTLETNSPWVICSQSAHGTSFGDRDHTDGALKSENSANGADTSHGLERLPQSSSAVQVPCSSPASLAHDKNSHVPHSGHNTGEVATSAQTEGEGNQITTLFNQKELINRPILGGPPLEASTIRPGIATDVKFGAPLEASTIRPGIATDVKFGGCGSIPDLPWVSTTGRGPNGKTISGVTYKYNKDLIKIVCACHGSHMSPEEFIQHANVDSTNQEYSTNSL